MRSCSFQATITALLSSNSSLRSSACSRFALGSLSVRSRFAPRLVADFDVMNPVTNEVIGVGKVPVLSLSGVGRWCDVIPPLTDANDNVAKPFKGLDQNNDNSVGCVWFACGLRIKSDSETIPNPPSPSSTSSEDLAVTQPKGLENPLPPAFPPAEVSKPSETQIKVRIGKPLF